MKEILKNRKGITLIALIVTIIVLLILAGISIGAITGNNGIINQAKNAKNDTEYSQWEEQIDVAIVDAENKHREPTMDDVIAELINKKVINDESQVDKTTGAITTNEPSYIIEDKLNDYIERITAADLANGNKEEIYGAVIDGYECPSAGVDEWQIFYADENNIYIIAADYIPYENIPNSTKDGKKTENKPIKGSNKRTACFSSVINDYSVGAGMITSPKIQALNSDFFEKYPTSDTENTKAVAYMLDTNAWSDFAGEKAEYAIGGPTIELFLKSYNEKYPDENYNNGKYQAKATSEIGYKISGDGGNTWRGNDSSYFINNDDSSYVINSKDEADGMWIASPIDSYGEDEIINIYYSGKLTSSNLRVTSPSLGFRPIVCLNSNVELQDNGNGTFSILE